MATYLFLWNPTRDATFPALVAEFDARGPIVSRWSCGNAANVQPGDRAILRRTTIEPKGVVGIGEIVRGTFIDEPLVAGGSGKFVDIAWEQLRLEPFVTQGALELAASDRLWTGQAGGIALAESTGDAVFEAVRAVYWSFIPPADQFISYWRSNTPSENQQRMLAAHYWSLDSDMHPSVMARAMEWPNADSAHLHYGRFARRTAEGMGVVMPRSDRVAFFCSITGAAGDVRWHMHDAVRLAVEALGFHDRYPPTSTSAATDAVLVEEGRRSQLMVSMRGRSATVRDHCLAVHGCVCAVCGLAPIARLGTAFDGLIEVHHLDPMAGGERTTDPAKDCVPLCPTCHRLAHVGMPSRSCRPITELRELRKRLRTS